MILSAWLAACGGGGESMTPDAGNPDAAAVEVAPAAPPVLTPCPNGWREVPPVDMVHDVVTCDPWPATGQAICAADEVHLPGTPGCARIGTACPAGDWPDGLPAGGIIIYVRAGAPAGGDGAIATPYATIAEALAGMPAAGAVIALAKGTYDERVNIPGGVTIWGACVAQTIVTLTTPMSLLAVLYTSSPGVVVKNLQVTGDAPGLGVYTSISDMTVEDVLVTGTSTFGIEADRGRIVGSRVVVRDVRADMTGGYGEGIYAERGGRVELSRVAIERVHQYGAVAFDANTLVVLEDVAILDTAPRAASGTLGSGVGALSGGRVEVHRGALERNQESGANAWEPGSVAVLEDVVIRDTLPESATQDFGHGAYAVYGGRLELTRVQLVANRSTGLIGFDPGSTVAAQDVVVRGTLPRAATGSSGRGVAAQDGARVELTRAHVVDNLLLGVHAIGPGAVLVLTDVEVRDTRSGTFMTSSGEIMSDSIGRGVTAEDAAELRIVRARIAGNRSAGVVVLAGATATVEDLEVVDTLVQTCEEAAACETLATASLSVLEADVVVTRFRLANSALLGIQVAFDGRLDLHEGTVEGNPIGANVQVAGFDLLRLQDGVTYRDNGINFAGDDLPVPPTTGR